MADKVIISDEKAVSLSGLRYFWQQLNARLNTAFGSVTNALDGKANTDLSNLSSSATARTNLSVYSKTETDAAINAAIGEAIGGSY